MTYYSVTVKGEIGCNTVYVLLSANTVSVVGVINFNAVKECINITELTPFILNKLISKIEIGCLETVDGEKQQVVGVEWKLKI